MSDELTKRRKAKTDAERQADLDTMLEDLSVASGYLCEVHAGLDDHGMVDAYFDMTLARQAVERVKDSITKEKDK